MTAPKVGVRASPPQGYEVREAKPHESQEDVKAQVEIFNDAFSVYDTFWPWRIESARRYYEDLFERRKAVVYVAYFGREGIPPDSLKSTYTLHSPES